MHFRVDGCTLYIPWFGTTLYDEKGKGQIVFVLSCKRENGTFSRRGMLVWVGARISQMLLDGYCNANHNITFVYFFREQLYICMLLKTFVVMHYSCNKGKFVCFIFVLLLNKG